MKKLYYNQNKILWAVETNSGCIRQHNEDYYIARPALGLWVLCDGLGGHSMGALASRICAETITQHVFQGESLQEVIQIAHQKVRQLQQESPDLSKKPGSTVAALLLSKKKWEVAWVGDTRVWLFEKKRIQQITKDHTAVQKLLDWGSITEQEAKVHPDRHILTRAVGIGKAPLKIGVESGRWNAKQVFILGTDGMAYRDDPQILSNILSNTVNPDQVVDELKYASLKNGGHDNFTIAVVGRSLKNCFIQEAMKKSRDLFIRQTELGKNPQPMGSF